MPERALGDHDNLAWLSESDCALTSEDEEIENGGGTDIDARSGERSSFPRVLSLPNLVSRTSLLTTMAHQRTDASTSHLAVSHADAPVFRSRIQDGATKTPPKTSCHRRPQPAIITAPSLNPPVLSPRSSRRNMLAREMPQSLRKDILWERKVTFSAFNAGSKRRNAPSDMRWNFSSVDVDHGLPDCHWRGW